MNQAPAQTLRNIASSSGSGADITISTVRSMRSSTPWRMDATAVSPRILKKVALARLALVYPITDCRFGTASFREDSTHSYLRPSWLEWFRGHYVTSDREIHDWRVSALRSGSPRAAMSASAANASGWAAPRRYSAINHGTATSLAAR